jgi:hypothetical protein
MAMSFCCESQMCGQGFCTANPFSPALSTQLMSDLAGAIKNAFEAVAPTSLHHDCWSMGWYYIHTLGEAFRFMRHREYPNLPHPLLGAFTNYVRIDIDSTHPMTTDLGFGNWTIFIYPHLEMCSSN